LLVDVTANAAAKCVPIDDGDSRRTSRVITVPVPATVV
jgi:hypothetical protein